MNNIVQPSWNPYSMASPPHGPGRVLGPFFAPVPFSNVCAVPSRLYGQSEFQKIFLEHYWAELAR